METKREQLIGLLSGEIRNGRFSGTSKLPPERLLAQSLGVTRGLLREALLTMEGRGLLTIAGRDGVYVNDSGAAGVAVGLSRLSQWPEVMDRNILEVRLILEVPAAQISARNRTEADVAKMEECLEILAGLDEAEGSDSRQGDSWDSMLHEAVVRSTGNELLIRIYEGVSFLMREFTERNRTFLFASVPGWAGQASQEHRLLVAAIRGRDPSAAGEVMRQHLCRTLRDEEADRIFSCGREEARR